MSGGPPGGLLNPTSLPADEPVAQTAAAQPAATPELQSLALEVLPLAAAGFGLVTADLFAPASAHLLQSIDSGAHAWVSATWGMWDLQTLVAGKIISDAAVCFGLAGWAGVAVAAVHTRSPRVFQALGASVAMYWLGGGRIPHSDPVLVDLLKNTFQRIRPSELHNTYSFPSGHTTGATFVCGTLLFLLLPAALHALEEQEQRRAGSAAGISARHPAVDWVLQYRYQLLGAAAGVTAVGRVLADKHWTSDTLAGGCLGVALAAATVQLCSAVDGWLRQQRSRDDSS